MLEVRGYKVTAVKCDPYLNVDAGTMNPYIHGEVFVLDDGYEADMDLGTYERFLTSGFSRLNNVTSGQIYQEVIRKDHDELSSRFDWIPVLSACHQDTI